jgi:hypothetical protein
VDFGSISLVPHNAFGDVRDKCDREDEVIVQDHVLGVPVLGVLVPFVLVLVFLGVLLSVLVLVLGVLVRGVLGSVETQRNMTKMRTISSHQLLLHPRDDTATAATLQE